MFVVFASALAGLLSTQLASTLPNVEPTGAFLTSPPDYAPGDDLSVSSPTLNAGIDAYIHGQDSLAIETLAAWLESRQGPWGEQRASGRFLLAWLYKESGRFNEASTQFSIVRNSEVPLTEEASWWEAWVDLQRGRPLVSARECIQYRERWPFGVHHGECLLLMADAYKAAGHNRTARQTYDLWLTENPSSLIRDRVLLDLAVLEALNGWSRGASRLSDLMLNSRLPHTALEAHAELLRNMEGGATAPSPSPLIVAKGTIQSLIQRGELDAAWELFLQSGGSDGSEAIGRWSVEEHLRIMWSTRRYDEYVESQMERYLQAPTGETGWKIFRGYQKGGRFSLAAEWGERMITSHPRHRRWRRAHDQIAQMWQLGGDYTKAREHWRQLAQRNGRIGRAGRWYVAWTTFRLGEFTRAVELFSEIFDSGVENRLAASYYLGRAQQEMGEQSLALAHYTATLSEAPNNWYGELAIARIRQLGEQDPRVEQIAQVTVDGSWQSPRVEERNDLMVSPPPIIATGQSIIRGSTPNGVVATAGPLFNQVIDWSAVRSVSPDYDYPEPTAHFSPVSPSNASPNSYENNPHFDSENAESVFNRFVANNENIWPALPAIRSLASVGLYELAGPMMESIRGEYRDARQEQGARATIVRSASVTSQIWRSVSRHCRDHNTVARSVSRAGGDEIVIDHDDRAALWLRFPTAYISTLTEHAESNDIDPLLTLSLMRQESLYRATARSRVGANGLMQVMPATGTKIALALGERFSPDLLAQPETNIRYGTWYLSQLNRRFEGSWPIALAAYNAGPMNVSSWYAPWLGEIQLDDFVEQIPFRETREYVKSLVGYYSIHLALYSPNSSMEFSLSTGHDHPEIIDF